MFFWHLLVLSDFSCYALKRFFQNSPPNQVFNPLSFLFFFFFNFLYSSLNVGFLVEVWTSRTHHQFVWHYGIFLANWEADPTPRAFGSISIVLCCIDQRSYSTLSERIPSDWILSWNCIPCRTTQQHFPCNSLFAMRLRYVYLTLINVYCPVERF